MCKDSIYKEPWYCEKRFSKFFGQNLIGEDCCSCDSGKCKYFTNQKPNPDKPVVVIKYNGKE